jgi:Ca2+-binding RTX toxin-like protein
MALPQSVTPIIIPDPFLEIIPFGDNPRVVLVNNGQETLVQSAPRGTNFNFITTVNGVNSSAFRPTNAIVGDKGTWVYDGKVNYFDGTTRKEAGTGTESILFKDGVLFFDARNAPGKVFYFDGTTTTQISDGALVYRSLELSFNQLLLATNKPGDLVTWKQADGKIALFDGQTIKTLDGSDISLTINGRGRGIVGPEVVDISPDRVVYKSFSRQYIVKYSNPELDLGPIGIFPIYFLQATPDYIYYNGVNNGRIVRRSNDGSEKSIPNVFTNLSTSQGNSLAVGNDLYFKSNDADGISQVYRFNENQAIQISQNTVNAQVTLLAVNNRLFFTASDGNDAEIYSYDGTSLLQVTDNSIEDKPLAPIASADGSTFFWYQKTSNDLNAAFQGELYNAVQNTLATFEISSKDIYQVFSAQFNAQNGLILAGKQITLSLTPIDPPLSLSGTDRDDYLIGKGGNDTIAGLDGNDTVTGAAGNDILYGNNGSDQLDGGTGNDTIYGGNDNDIINGDEGNDLIFGDNGNDSIDGGQGNDLLVGNQDDDTLFGDDGDDFAFGGTGNDSISGGNGIDNLEGNEGDDTILGGDGNDGLAGQEGDDSLVGGNGNDRLYGWLGNDILIGDAGSDTLYGDSGSDLLTGGADADTFRFGSDFITGAAFSSLGLDTITDFQSGVDKIQLERSAFSALPTTLSFATVADDSLAATRSEIIVYSQGTGSIFYNANGAADGFGDGGSFAQLTGNPSIAATDFDLLPASVLAV